MWLLVGLSFAYGIFHAAGPGHGKAVISSYMLANEVALRRGIMLSFVSAFLQAVTAIVVMALAVPGAARHLGLDDRRDLVPRGGELCADHRSSAPGCSGARPAPRLRGLFGASPGAQPVGGACACRMSQAAHSHDHAPRMTTIMPRHHHHHGIQAGVLRPAAIRMRRTRH